jgi:hypothetical protein
MIGLVLQHCVFWKVQVQKGENKNDVVFSLSIYLWSHKFPLCIGVGDFTILGHDNHVYSHNHYLDTTMHINKSFWGTQHIIITKFVVYH